MKSAFRVTLAGLLLLAPIASAEEIIHDAEYYVLKAQNGERWETEDKALEKKLAAMRDKHGRPPNIVYILWDDQQFGTAGFPGRCLLPTGPPSPHPRCDRSS